MEGNSINFHRSPRKLRRRKEEKERKREEIQREIRQRGKKRERSEQGVVTTLSSYQKEASASPRYFSSRITWFAPTVEQVYDFAQDTISFAVAFRANAVALTGTTFAREEQSIRVRVRGDVRCVLECGTCLPKKSGLRDDPLNRTAATPGFSSEMADR